MARFRHQLFRASRPLLRFLAIAFATLLMMGLLGNIKATATDPDQLVQAGHVWLDRGQPQAAIPLWRQALQLYQTAGNTEAIAGTLLNLSNAHQAMGRFDLACPTLLEALNSSPASWICDQNTPLQPLTGFIQSVKNQPLAPALLENLGNVLTRLGRLELAQSLMEQAIPLASQPDGVRLNLANNHFWQFQQALDRYQNTTDAATQAELMALIQTQYQQAGTLYQQVSQSQNAGIRLKSQLNELEMLLDFQSWSDRHPGLISVDQSRLSSLLASLSDSDFSVLPGLAGLKAQLTFASRLGQLAIPERFQQAYQISTQVLAQAQQQQIERGVSLAYGTLGQLYTQTQQTTETQRAYELALESAQAIKDPGLLYQWQYGLAKIYQHQGNLVKSNQAYEATLDSLNAIRPSLSGINPEIQFAFTTKIAPIYQKYAQLLLAGDRPDIEGGLRVLEDLKLRELESYLGCGRLNLLPLTQVLANNAAYVYLFTLDDQMEVIVRDPSGKYHRHQPNSAVVRPAFDALSQNLRETDFRNLPETMIRRWGQTLYSQLLAPVVSFLPVGTPLVFIPDLSFQNLPFSLLFNGHQYLVENYPLAISTPASRTPKPLASNQFRALIGGISVSAPSFAAAQLSPLPNVTSEVQGIKTNLRQEYLLLNENFTVADLSQAAAKGLPILHLATHGQFSSCLKTLTSAAQRH
ncbi:MAG: CHAT domain-containing protein [Aphanocapsa sp. GSE-SYN-MK-11-07L]|jgi:tetratricopeptide (TPR) repeat protein|nr:CHAT domain-containing protein [Aphanocapsa sp. GSE-SYN-MK-11-07L]